MDGCTPTCMILIAWWSWYILITPERNTMMCCSTTQYCGKIQRSVIINMVLYSMISHVVQQWLMQNINKRLHSQKPSHNWPPPVSYVYCKDLGQNWPHHNGTALYIEWSTVLDFGNPNALAMEVSQFCTKPSWILLISVSSKQFDTWMV